MLIWRGWGIAVVLLGFGALLGAQLLIDALAGRGTYSRDSSLFGGPALALGGVVIFFLGRWLNDPRRARVLVDKQTGEEVLDRPRNDFFFFPMEWWGLALVLIGLGWFLSGLLNR